MFEFLKVREPEFYYGLVVVFMCCISIIVAAALDMTTKIEAVKAAKKKVQSRPMAKTGMKIVEYLRLILFVFFVDLIGFMCFGFWTIPYAVVLITFGILWREGLSMYENYKLKKSAAAEAVDYTKKIMQALTEEEANKVLKLIRELNDKK